MSPISNCAALVFDLSTYIHDPLSVVIFMYALVATNLPLNGSGIEDLSP